MMARRLAQSKGEPVTAGVYAALDLDKLTMSSFSAREAQRNAMIKERLSHLMERIQDWEQDSGQTVAVTFRPDQAAMVVTAPGALFEELAEDDAVAAVDVEKA